MKKIGMREMVADTAEMIWKGLQILLLEWSSMLTPEPRKTRLRLKSYMITDEVCDKFVAKYGRKRNENVEK